MMSDKGHLEAVLEQTRKDLEKEDSLLSSCQTQQIVQRQMNEAEMTLVSEGEIPSWSLDHHENESGSEIVIVISDDGDGDDDHDSLTLSPLNPLRILACDDHVVSSYFLLSFFLEMHEVTSPFEPWQLASFPHPPSFSQQCQQQ